MTCTSLPTSSDSALKCSILDQSEGFPHRSIVLYTVLK